MHLSQSTWLAVTAAALLTMASSARAEDAWTLTTFFDDINHITVKIAAVDNADGDRLKVHAPSNDSKVWATFLLPTDTPAAFDASRGLSWEIADGRDFSLDAVTRTIATQCGEPASELHHAGPQYISFVIAEASEIADSASPLAALRDAGGSLRVRYALADNTDHEAVFTLNGANVAIGEVMALVDQASQAQPALP